MKTSMIAALWLALCAGHALAQSRRFVCAGMGSASSLGKVAVTVVTKAEQVQGQVHSVGTVTIGRVGKMLFWVSWDATGPSIAVGRSDGDGFEAAASASGGDLVLLRSKRPNEEEAQIACSPR